MISLAGTNISSLYYGSSPISQAYFGSNLIYQSTPPEPASALLYTSAFDFTAKAATERKMNVNYTFPTATYDYFAVKYGCAFTANGQVEYDYNARSNNFDWQLIVCPPVTGSRVPMYWGNKGFTSTGVTVDTNGSTKRVYINGVSPGTVRPYKVIYDNPGLKAHLFYNGTEYITFTGLSGIATEFQNLHLHCWHSFSVTARPSGCQIAGFKDLTAAQAW